MKKITLLTLITVLLLASCQKQAGKRDDRRNTGRISLENARIVSRGNIVFSSGTNSGGEATIYRLPDGKFVVGLEKLNFSSPTDVELHLSKVPEWSLTSVYIFGFLAVNGTLYNEIPFNINVADFPYVILQNDIVQGTIAVAELK